MAQMIRMAYMMIKRVVFVAPPAPGGGPPFIFNDPANSQNIGHIG